MLNESKTSKSQFRGDGFGSFGFVVVSHPDKAQIISVSGASGANYPKDASQAMGKTDSAGNISMMIQAADPGKFTLVATDTASEKEGTVNFFAVPKG